MAEAVGARQILHALSRVFQTSLQFVWGRMSISGACYFPARAVRSSTPPCRRHGSSEGTPPLFRADPLIPLGEYVLAKVLP